MRFFQASDRLQDGLCTQLLGNLRGTEMQGHGPIRVEDHFDLAYVAAQNLDPANPPHPRKRRFEDEFAKLAQSARVDRPGEVVGKNGE